jgi:hypothetical protein
MGLWDKIKGWLNIGGVKVLLWKYSEPLKKSNPVITGAVLLKTKSPKTVLSVEVKFIEELTYQEDDQAKTDTKVLGRYHVPSQASGLGYPLHLQPGENREEPFTVHVAPTDRLQNRGACWGPSASSARWRPGSRWPTTWWPPPTCRARPLTPPTRSR